MERKGDKKTKILGELIPAAVPEAQAVIDEDDLRDLSAIEKVQQYMYVRHYGSKITVTFNEKAIAATKKYHGYFALVSSGRGNQGIKVYDI